MNFQIPAKMLPSHIKSVDQQPYKQTRPIDPVALLGYSRSI